MSERVQQLLYEVRRATDEYKPALAERFPGAGQQSLDALRTEVASEIAYSLGRAGSKIERSIRLLTLLLTRRDQLELDADERQQLRDAYLLERRQAERHVRDLLIQREALGFRQHHDVRQRYALPDW